jgi:hypothetical protein
MTYFLHGMYPERRKTHPVHQNRWNRVHVWRGDERTWTCREGNIEISSRGNPRSVPDQTPLPTRDRMIALSAGLSHPAMNTGLLLLRFFIHCMSFRAWRRYRCSWP